MPSESTNPRFTSNCLILAVRKCLAFPNFLCRISMTFSIQADQFLVQAIDYKGEILFSRVLSKAQTARK